MGRAAPGHPYRVQSDCYRDATVIAMLVVVPTPADWLTCAYAFTGLIASSIWHSWQLHTRAFCCVKCMCCVSARICVRIRACERACNYHVRGGMGVCMCCMLVVIRV